jgi:large subunit ribosomal protein L1
MAKTKRRAKHSVRFSGLETQVDKVKVYDLEDALKTVKTLATAKFDESIDLSVKLGVDPRKGDQNVRGTTNLPHGTGKNKVVAVLAKGDLAKEARDAGADIVGDEDLIKSIQEGTAPKFDVILATNDMAPQIGKIGRILGSRTPNKKNGTVTDAVTQAVKDIKSAVRVEYRVDKAGIVHMPIGRASFDDDKLKANLLAAVDALVRAKPSTAKGRYLQTMTVSSTMSPGLKLDPVLVSKASGH